MAGDQARPSARRPNSRALSAWRPRTNIPRPKQQPSSGVSLRHLASRDRKFREDGRHIVDIASGLLVRRQPPERVPRKDERLRHDEVISVSDRAVEHRTFLSSACIEPPTSSDGAMFSETGIRPGSSPEQAFSGSCS
jgi:hypothetical protein